MKDKILDIAIRQLKEGGYENLNFAKIAAELNTTRANLHHHFENKEGLALAAAENYVKHETEEMQSVINANDGDIFAIARGVEKYLTKWYTKSNSHYTCIASQLIREYEIPESLHKLAADYLISDQHRIENQIRKSLENGSFKSSEEPEKLAFRFMAVMMGITQLALVEADKEILTENIRGSLESIFK